jgi:hypothetical protein
MLFVLPVTPALHSTSYLAPQPYEYPDQGYYHLHPNVPRFAASLYPASQRRFFSQPSAEELEEREYQQALAIISNHRRRQAEKEAAIRRQQQAEAARQRYLVSLAAELEQQQQHTELLASRRVEVIRAQQARACLAAAERQLAVKEFFRQVKGVPSVRHVCILLPGLVLIISQKATCQPHVKPLPDALKQRLAGEPTESIQDTVPPTDSHPVHSKKPADRNEESAKLVEDILSSLLPGLIFHAQSAASAETDQPKTADNGKGETRAVDLEERRESARNPGSANAASASGSSNSSPIKETAPSVEPTVTETEQARVDRASSLSSVEHIRNSFTKLQTDFSLPAELDHYTPSTDDRDETASVSSASSRDLTRLIPYTSANKPVYKYEHELNGLLEELDRIDSHGDTEVRERRKEVVKAVERALEGVERVVGEVVEKRLSLVGPSTTVIEESLKGFDVDDIVDEVSSTSAEEPVDAPIVTDHIDAPEQSTPEQPEAVVAVSVERSSPEKEAIPESNTLVASDDTTTTPHAELPLTEPDFGLPTSTATPELTRLAVIEPESTEPRLPAEEEESVDTFLLPEKVSPPSPAKKRWEIESDIDDEVLVLDSDEEKSDWSEIEN